MDDGIHIDPTKSNIIDAFKKLAELSEPGDVVYVHFAGKINNTFKIFFAGISPSCVYTKVEWYFVLFYVISLLVNKGHGAYEYDTTGEEVDRYDETIYPIDYSTAGAIVDDEILTSLVLPMGKGMFCVLLTFTKTRNLFIFTKFEII